MPRRLTILAVCAQLALSIGVVRCDAADQHWSFAPISHPPTPSTRARGGDANAIDAFVRRKLDEVQIAPSPLADPATQIRRVKLDLLGLPPTEAEVERFVRDDRPDRYERLVDRLLASPHYGEKWARPWLDLSHYADTDGYLTDQQRPVAWRYRAWLIDALNRNQPFDQFTIDQLAGDLRTAATIEQRTATGFLRQTLSNREGGAEPEEFRVKQVVDRTEMVGAAWLGLTVGCARCHDHKYDELTQREFFRLYACLDGADEINIDAPLPREATAFWRSRDEYNRRRRELIDPQRDEIESLQRRWEQKCLAARNRPGEDALWDRRWELLGLVWGGGLGEGQLEGQEIVKLPWSRRTARQRDDLLDFFLAQGSVIDEAKFKELKLGSLAGQLKQLKSSMPTATRAPVMRSAVNSRPTRIHEQGDFRRPGERVRPATPAALPAWQDSSEDPRLRLARWLASPANPLTARVVVNRAWEQFFGRGLVETTEDFGVRGGRPSHPELLDWLASEFVASGWDTKWLHREIVCSATYRRSSAHRPALAQVDPANTLLARQNALRVSSDTIRDMCLSISGLLVERIGGPSVKPPQSPRVTMEGFGNQTWEVSDPPDRYRRGIYTFVIRTTPFAQAITFDAPNPNEICTRRLRSNTPLQALTLLNDPVFFEMAREFAKRVGGGGAADAARDQRRLSAAFRLCVARNPQPDELAALVDLLKTQRLYFGKNLAAARAVLGEDVVDADLADGGNQVANSSERVAWVIVCSALFNLHEFVTRG
ncbi:MAG: DUF1549 and DUF1553 domain-containing protein [Pirellulaceae bacterium]|jgi:hypothetical protein|nr:DUF1549 and DUF1553 domain-containing protein [Pirellulaceae bacterium]